MKRSWRFLAWTLFLGAVAFGGLFGDQLLAVGDDETDEQIRLYTEMLQIAHDSYGTDVEYRDLVYASIRGMLRFLDPHTSFLSPEDYDSMRSRQQSSFYGLGILVSMRNGQLTVISPIEGTPAWRLGLRAGDVINSIEGEPTDTMSLDEAVNKLKGPKGTEVGISIVRRGLTEPLPLNVTRAEIPQNTVRYAYMIAPQTGYIRLTDFSRSTAGEMTEAIDDLESQGMERLVLDLRSNGGGLLDQVIEVAHRFVPPDTKIVETRGRTRDSDQSFFAEDGRPLDKPLVVLVNNGTASAAEILAGAVQDHDVGLVVGTPTWGKGLVQTVYNLSYGAGIALTTAKYYTPSGRLIQRDYSSYFDYYTHFGGEDEDEQLEVSVDEPAFDTDLGRTVYGGGGITPDVEVDLPQLPEILQFLYARNAFFDFAVDFTRQNTIDSATWQPPADLLDRFGSWLLEEELVEPEEIEGKLQDETVSAYASRQIHADILNATFGTEASHRVLAAGDTQIQRALELFDEAEQLLASRQTMGTDVRTPALSTEPPAGATGESVPDGSLP
ncbi:MAG: S41 family peptidase [Acidobacteriota bacterium]